MIVLASFFTGYMLGTKAGREGLQELIDSWQKISSSEEFRGMFAQISTMGGEMLKQGSERAKSGGLTGMVTDQAKVLLFRKFGSRAA